MRALGLTLALAAAAMACGQRPSEASAPQAVIRAVVTAPVVGMWLRGIGGADVDVHLLVPPGASPHIWQPSAADMRAVADADLAVVVGGGLEPWAGQLLDAAAARRRLVLVDWLAQQGLVDVPQDAGDHGHAFDPHVWLSPTLADEIVAHLVGVLCEIAPERRESFLADGEVLSHQISDAVRECVEMRPVLSRLRVIQFHRSWENLARDAGFTVVGTIEPTPGIEPGPRAMRELIDLIRSQGANAVIAEPQLNPAAAQRLAETAGVPLVTLDPYGRMDETYAEFTHRNLAALAAAASAER